MRMLLAVVLVLFFGAWTYGETVQFDVWRAGFETTDYPPSPGPIPCGAFLTQYGPDFTLNGWMTWTSGIGATRVKSDCSMAFTGSKSMSLSRSSTGAASNVYARPFWPYNVSHEGTTIVFEEDIYIPAGPGIDPNLGLQWYAIGNGVNVAAKWIVQANSTWLYFNGVDYTSTGVDFVPNTWNHVRVNLEPNLVWNCWVTPQGQPEVQVFSNIPSVDMPNMDWSTLFYVYGSPGKPGTVYVDNARIWWIVHNSQGFPVIPVVSPSLVVDGHINPGEWMTKVANKPTGGSGNFCVPWHFNKYNSHLDPTTTADIWAAYDANFIYIAGQLNNAQHALADANQDAEIEALFTYKGATAADYRQYVFGARAIAADGNSGYWFGYQNTINPPTSLDVNYVDFRNAGGKIFYSASSGNIMEIEMKIPLSVMPQFTGVTCGGKMNLQFNVRGMTTGTTAEPYYGWYSTNNSMLLYPGQDSGGAVDPNKPLVGITFEGGPGFGDLDSDCHVNFKDVKLLANNWLSVATPPIVGDINGDNKVNFTDFALLGENWTECFVPICN